MSCTLFIVGKTAFLAKAGANAGLLLPCFYDSIIGHTTSRLTVGSVGADSDGLNLRPRPLLLPLSRYYSSESTSLPLPRLVTGSVGSQPTWSVGRPSKCCLARHEQSRVVGAVQLFYFKSVAVFLMYIAACIHS